MSSIGPPILGSQPRTAYSSLQNLTRKMYNCIEKRLSSKACNELCLEDAVSVVCISDTHNSKPVLPDGDILLHAGDLSQYGTFAEIRDQVAWLRSLPHQHKIVIAGNHDLLLDESFVKSHADRDLDKKGAASSDIDWADIIYIKDELVTVEVRGRTLAVFGSPWTPRCGSFAFQYDRPNDIWEGKIHSGLDIVLVHGPPAVYLDDGKGCEALLSAIHQARPQVAVFGHIHSARGQRMLTHDRASLLYEDIMLGRRHWLGFCQLLLCLLSRRTEHDKAAVTTLVNAAMPSHKDGHRDSQAIIIEL